MDKKLRLINIISILFIFGFCYFIIIRNSDIFFKIFEINGLSFMALTGLIIITIFTNGLMTSVLVAIFGVKLTTFEYFSLSSINTLGNYLPIKLGLIIKGAYLKKAKDFPISSYATTLAANMVLSFFTAGIIGVAITTFLYVFHLKSSIVLFLFFLSISAVCIAMLVVKLKVPVRLGRVGTFLANVLSGWTVIRGKKHSLAKLLALNAMLILTYAFRLYVSATALGITTNFSHYLLFALMGNLSLFIALTPGSLGIREVLIGLSASQLGGDLVYWIVISSLDRIVSILCVFFTGVPAMFFLSRTYKFALSQKSTE